DGAIKPPEMAGCVNTQNRICRCQLRFSSNKEEDMNRVVKAFFAATLAAGLVFGSITAGDVMAKDRGKSGLPPGPGNPLASLQSQINQLQTQINELKPQANLLWINHLGLMADPVDTLTVSQATAPLAGA